MARYEEQLMDEQPQMELGGTSTPRAGQGYHSKVGTAVVKSRCC